MRTGGRRGGVSKAQPNHLVTGTGVSGRLEQSALGFFSMCAAAGGTQTHQLPLTADVSVSVKYSPYPVPAFVSSHSVGAKLLPW